VILGGLGQDVIDGGDGDDIEIQLVASDDDKVTSVTAADKAWMVNHLRIVDGKTVIDVGSKQRTLRQTDLSQLIHDAASS
jgi:DNA-binding cell septation regulator SpoVG